ncbi:hypothetical protein Leryth_004547 [Lithospermum erythrorhizon]|nr:hypothetical protein Leryth_004547 [Lithospermum erythrorhizon]
MGDQDGPNLPTDKDFNSKDDTPSTERINTIESRFNQFCKNGLSMDENWGAQAAKLLSETEQLLLANASSFGSGVPGEAERYWFAFVLYAVRRLGVRESERSSQLIDGNRFTLCQILRHAKLSISDFFKELPQFVVKAGSILRSFYGEDWEKRLEAKELQANVIHLSLLSKFYKRAFQEFFLTREAYLEKHPADADATSHLSNYYRFGWLLFLALRGHMFSRFKDLVTCTNGLVSILAILIIHIPIRFRNFNVNDSPRLVRNGDNVDLIASLCKSYETTEDELRKTLEKTNNLIRDLLEKSPLLASECTAENLQNIDPDCFVYFKDLLEGSSLSSSLSVLEKDYEEAMLPKGELDERIYVNEEDSLLGSGSLSGGSLSTNTAKRKSDSLASPEKTMSCPLSPFRSPSRSYKNGIPIGGNMRIAATPVSTAMTTVKWLRAIIAPLQPKPSVELERFFSSCDKNIMTDVVRRAVIILEAIFPSSGPGDHCATGTLQSSSLMDNIWAEQRRLEALKLYYRVLEAMCRAESQILNANNLTSLLTNERFHRCMLACSAELVLATHKTVTMLFPAVLERTGITAFDLSKVIESFIRHEDSLPRELRRHLNSLEERLLESMVWEKGSSMYNSLAVASPSLSGEINRLGLLAEPMLSLDAIAMHINMSSGGQSSVPFLVKHENDPGLNGDIRSPKRPCMEYRSVLVERNSFTSPVKDRVLALNNQKSKPHPALQSAFASPTRPNPGGGGETCAETAIRVFFSKIVKLAAVRINGMVERLQLPQQIRESVYCLFGKIVNSRPTLFFNRHIDQIILCCFYGVAKISQLSLTFREIIYNYQKQPHCKPQVFRSVFVDSSSRRSGRSGPDHVDIITFYNEIFVPNVKPLLVELAPLGITQRSNESADAKSYNDGPSPMSPKTSSFPSLPDMSPKKVSMAHNIYVSPLRQSKMDVLNSNTSKSYYACVGESTHAYQSPSKDLTAINNRLNGSIRKVVRGPLNFDVADGGLVSDSLVANALPPQNRTFDSLSFVPTKSEQPDK